MLVPVGVNFSNIAKYGRELKNSEFEWEDPKNAKFKNSENSFPGPYNTRQKYL
jgi:hypothetical protein